MSIEANIKMHAAGKQ